MGPNNLFWSSKGQTLIETVVALPLFLTLITTFFTFIYKQILTQRTEHLLHEVAVCESTINEKMCLSKANYEANRYNLLNTVFIHRTKNKEYAAKIIEPGTLKWNTLKIKMKSPSIQKMDSY